MNTRKSLFESDASNRDTWIGDRVLDSSIFLAWAAQDQLLESINHFLENTDNVTLLVGPHGAGKTTLVYRLQGKAQDHWMLFRVDANPMLHTDQLLQSLIRRIGLASGTSSSPEAPPQEKYDYAQDPDAEDEINHNLPVPLGEEALVDVLHSSFGNLRLQGRLPIVLIDDADQLPISTLQSILRLHERTVEGMSPFALILLAEPAIDTMLASRQLNVAGNSHFQRLETPRIAVEQMDQYILHFLRVACIRETPKWSMDQLILIHQEAAGLPGRINDLIKQGLREEAAMSRSPTTGSRLRWFVVGLLGMGAIGFGILQFPETNIILTKWLSGFLQQSTNQGWISQNLPLPNLDSSRTTPSTLPDASDNDDGLATNSATGTKLASKIQQVPLVKPLPLPAASRDSSGTTDGGTSGTDPTAPADANNMGSPAPAAADFQANAKRNDWVLKQAVTTYTLQITTTSSETAAQRYIARNNLSPQAFYVEVKRGNKTMYYILYGTYPSRTEANTVLSKMPANLRRKGAWPRPLGKLQSELHN